ncbi:MAG: S1 RNA-binding domain-containing protein, partial [Lachnospiraceae bacterium]|nr:S1 RNA-binding domain-containing protein [Lachnospiraceae bacterium]
DKPSDVLKVGQEIEAKVLDFSEDDKKISISIKALTEPPVSEETAEAEATESTEGTAE